MPLTSLSGRPALVVHGGAWDIPATWRASTVEGCRAGAAAGWAVLAAGGSAVDAVVAAIRVLEDCPVLGAAHGAERDASGGYRLDASIMRGSDLAAGAAAWLPPTRHPIDLARAIMDHSPHVLLVGERALAWGAPHGVLPCDPTELDLSPALEAERRGGCDTVGCVAIDAAGRLAAGTSTGGTPGRHPARVGDAPLIGCGTYCDDEAGGASSTGMGEAIIRMTLARAGVDGLRAGEHPRAAAARLTADLTRRTAGAAGLILLDRAGRVGVAHTTSAMCWALRSADAAAADWQ